MNISFYLKLYALTIPVFFVIDLIWLGLVAKNFYRSNLKLIISPEVNWLAAVVFYLIYISGILFFAVRPAIDSNSLGTAAALGALFGFFTYATYDLTNMATIKEWPLKIAVVDILWGTCLCVFVASLSFIISKRLV